MIGMSQTMRSWARRYMLMENIFIHISIYIYIYSHIKVNVGQTWDKYKDETMYCTKRLERRKRLHDTDHTVFRSTCARVRSHRIGNKKEAVGTAGTIT
jgi:hypothetical protein